MFRALAEGRINRSYIEKIRKASTNCSSDRTVFTNPAGITIRKGVRQDDPLSLKLFNVCLEISRQVNLKNGKSINGDQRNHS